MLMLIKTVKNLIIWQVPREFLRNFPPISSIGRKMALHASAFDLSV